MDTHLDYNVSKKRLIACIMVIIDCCFEWSLCNSVLHISIEILLCGNYSRQRCLSYSECYGSFSSIAVGKAGIA